MFDVDTVMEMVRTHESLVSSGPIVPYVTPTEIREYLEGRYDFSAPIDIGELCSDVERMLQTWQVQVTHPRYLGLFNPSVTPPSILGDALTAIYNPQLATWRTSPAANEIERHVLGWLGRKFGLPSNGLASFTSGGAEANLSATVVALTRAFPEYCNRGLQVLKGRPTLYLSDQAHHTFNKIAHMTGLGRDSVRVVRSRDDLTMDVPALERQLSEDRHEGCVPFMVVATAGTTAAGAIDPLPEIGRVCRSAGTWFHVDAAWGGAAIISPKLRGYLQGIEAADSITCDAHKWFSVPMGAGMFFCRHADAVCAAFGGEAFYMPRKTQGPVVDPYVASVQWSRRFIGLKLFMSLAHYGESGYVRMIEHQAQMADILREALRQTGWRIVNSTPLPLVCFTRDGLDATKFLSALYARQIAWMSEARLRPDSQPVIRACVTSFRTTEVDIRQIVGEINRLGW